MLHTVATATRSGARKTRPSHLLAAVVGAALALAVSTGVARLHDTAPQQSAQHVTTHPQLPATLVAPRGGAAEAIAESQTSVEPARGGLAEAVESTQPAFTLHTLDQTLAVPAHVGLAEGLAAAATVSVSLTSETGTAVSARGGLAEAIAEDNVPSSARSAAQTMSALRARGGMAEATADQLAAVTDGR